MREKIDDQPGMGLTYGNLGVVHEEMGDFAHAIEYYNKSINICEGIGDRHRSANTYFNLGILYQKMNEKEESKKYFMKAKALYEMIGNQQWVHHTTKILHNMGI